ncbi:MAG: hypothetical protein K0U41_09850 [Gammaproteobacteria bacterium]|nr:hypothetical protein [Gammaproteobacteria bacterium]
MRKLKSILMSAKLTLKISVVALLAFFITSCAGMTGPIVDSADRGFDIDMAGNYDAISLWSDGTTMWVGDWDDQKLYAYNLSSKSRDAAKDFNTLNSAGNNYPSGIWSDGTTMWVADRGEHKLYAYSLLTKARDAAKDFDTLSNAGNNSPAGIWSDGTTMWVVDQLGSRGDGKIYAYNLSSKNRDASKDINTLGDDGVNRSYGLWSDGTTMWVSDWEDDRLYAYNLLSGSRDVNKDFDTLFDAGNNSPYGLWSDGTTMWVADNADEKIYAYNMSTSIGGGTSSLVIAPINISDATLNIYQSTILATTVSNKGPGLSSATTLRWYLSSDSTISSSDTQVGADLVYGLSVGRSGSESITAPPISTSGTYYYGACVDAISGESSATDNCSSGTSVVVEAPIPDLTIDSVSVNNTNDFARRNPGLFSLLATVVNRGAGLSSATTVRYYVSFDSTISPADTEIPISVDNSVSPLFPGGLEKVGIYTFPVGAGSYYGVCVDAVSSEVTTANNCSIGIELVFN